MFTLECRADHRQTNEADQITIAISLTGVVSGGAGRGAKRYSVVASRQFEGPRERISEIWIERRMTGGIELAARRRAAP